MIDFTYWDKSQEFELETAANLWFASVNNVDLTEAPLAELNPYYNRLTAGIRNHQLKIEGAHFVLAEQGTVILTRFNLIQFLGTLNEYIPMFLLPSDKRWLVKEESPFKAWLLKALTDGELDGNAGLKYWLASLIKKLWLKFRTS